MEISIRLYGDRQGFRNCVAEHGDLWISYGVEFIGIYGVMFRAEAAFSLVQFNLSGRHRSYGLCKGPSESGLNQVRFTVYDFGFRG